MFNKLSATKFVIGALALGALCLIGVFYNTPRGADGKGYPPPLPGQGGVGSIDPPGGNTHDPLPVHSEQGGDCDSDTNTCGSAWPGPL